MTETSFTYLFPRAWWILPGRVLGGCYHGDLDPDLAAAKMKRCSTPGSARFFVFNLRWSVDAAAKHLLPIIRHESR